jgi:hypothetical protein
MRGEHRVSVVELVMVGLYKLNSWVLNLQKSGQFPDDPVRIKGGQIHYVNQTQCFLFIMNQESES